MKWNHKKYTHIKSKVPSNKLRTQIHYTIMDNKNNYEHHHTGSSSACRPETQDQHQHLLGDMHSIKAQTNQIQSRNMKSKNETHTSNKPHTRPSSGKTDKTDASTSNSMNMTECSTCDGVHTTTTECATPTQERPNQKRVSPVQENNREDIQSLASVSNVDSSIQDSSRHDISIPLDEGDKILDKVPSDMDPNHATSRSSLHGSRGGSHRSIYSHRSVQTYQTYKSGQTAANDSFKTNCTVPFVQELLSPQVDGQEVHYKEYIPHPRLSLDTLWTNHDNIIDVKTLETNEDDLSDLAANDFSLPLKTPENEKEMKATMKKALDAEDFGNYKDALQLYELCLSFQINRIDSYSEKEFSYHTVLGSIKQHIGITLWKLGDYVSSSTTLQDAKDEMNKALQICHTEKQKAIKEHIADIYNTLGKVYNSQGNYDAALEQHTEGLTLLKSLFADPHSEISTTSEQKRQDVLLHPGIAKCLISMGTIHSQSGKFELAMELLKGGFQIQKELYGPKHVEVASSLCLIGTIYEKTNRHDKAMQCYKRSYQIYKKELGDHVDVATCLNYIGQIYQHDGKFQKAMDSYKKALRIMKTHLGETHRNVAAALYNIGLIHMECQQYDKAMSVFKETLNMQRHCLGEEHIDLALTLESIGKIYEDNQRIDRALRCFYKALNIRDSVAPNSLELALISDKIGNCQIQINGDIREAMTCFEEAIKLYRLNGLDNNDPRLCNARKNFVSTVQAVERERREKDDELIGRDITI